jgi:hypothetical protein
MARLAEREFRACTFAFTGCGNVSALHLDRVVQERQADAQAAFGTGGLIDKDIITSSDISPRIGTHPPDNHLVLGRPPKGMARPELQGDTLLTIPSRQRTKTLLRVIAHSPLAESASLIGIPSERMDDKDRVKLVVKA